MENAVFLALGLCDFSAGNSVQRKALMLTIRSREIFTKKCRQQQNFDSEPKEAWHYNLRPLTPIAKNFMLYCRLIYVLSMLYVRLSIKVKVGIPESFKVGWYPHKITGSSHLETESPRTLSNFDFQWTKIFTRIIWSISYCFLHFLRAKDVIHHL